MRSNRMMLVLLLAASAILGGCYFHGDTAPCADLCDGIVRCRMGNARCVAEGSTARDPFMSACTAQCEESIRPIQTADQLREGHECLDCLRGADFGACNGELLVDEVCAEACSTPSAVTFRDTFGPALWTELSCLRE